MKCPSCNYEIDILYLEDCIEKDKDAICDKCKSVLEIGIDYMRTGDGDEQMLIDELTIKP